MSRVIFPVTLYAKSEKLNDNIGNVTMQKRGWMTKSKKINATKIRITNDPIEILFKIIEKYYPKIKTEIQYNDRIKRPGYTLFVKGRVPLINIKHDIPFNMVARVLAHELAHVVCGLDERHGKEWENTLNNIHELYKREMKKRGK